MSNVKTVHAEFCAVGDGIGALCAALAAARHGIGTVLISSGGMPALPPCTAAMCGGIGEEIALSCRCTEDAHFLARIAAREENLTVLSGTLSGTETDGARISAVHAEGADGAFSVYADTFALCDFARADGATDESRACETTGEMPDEQSLAAAAAFSDVVAFRLRDTDGTPYGVSFGELRAHGAENLYRTDAHDAAGGQAIGTAAAVGIKYNTTPAGVAAKHMRELQETLLYDDAFLPHIRRTVSEDAFSAELSCDDTVSGDILNLRTGIDRNSPIYGAGDQGFTAAVGASVEYHMDEAADVTRARIVFDADGDGDGMPPALAKIYALEVESDGEWEGILFENENTRRLVSAAICRPITGIRLTVMETWGAAAVHLFSFDFE